MLRIEPPCHPNTAGNPVKLSLRYPRHHMFYSMRIDFPILISLFIRRVHRNLCFPQLRPRASPFFPIFDVVRLSPIPSI